MITEKQLINSAKIFQSNCRLNGDKVSFSDACKVVLLAEISNQFSTKELEDNDKVSNAMVMYANLISRPFWKRWKIFGVKRFMM